VLLDQANLYGDVDCPKVSSLSELVNRIAAGEFD
jgi:hypothetical protein